MNTVYMANFIIFFTIGKLGLVREKFKNRIIFGVKLGILLVKISFFFQFHRTFSVLVYQDI